MQELLFLQYLSRINIFVLFFRNRFETTLEPKLVFLILVNISYNYRKMWNMRYMQFQFQRLNVSTQNYRIMKFIVPSYVRIYSLYIFLYVMLLLTLSVSVAGSCFLQWTQKILTINKKLSRYSLFVFYYFLDNLKKQATVQ